MSKTIETSFGIRKFFKFLSTHRIAIKPSKRIIGIRDALIGWGLIGITIVLFQVPIQKHETAINFLVQFISGTLFILLFIILKGFLDKDGLKGYKYLKISQKNITTDYSYFSPRQRLVLILIRGFIATSGYIIYELAKEAIGIVDNSALHGADAVIYAILAFIFLKQRFRLGEWLGIFIAFIGVTVVLYYDIGAINKEEALIGYLFGLGSSFALAIVVMLTSAIIQHDPPLRVTFYQCITGLIISLIVFLIFLFRGKLPIESFVTFDYTNAAIEGISYSIALIFFFRAFLHAEPIIIAISSSSLLIFISIFSLLKGHMVPYRDIISSLIITLGCGILIYQEYKKDKKKTPLEKAVEASRPIYIKKRSEQLKDLKNKYKMGKIGKYEYISEMYEKNKILFEISTYLNKTSISEISLTKDSVIFTVEPYKIKFEVDKSCRSALLEILNFGDYEHDDEVLIYQLIKDKNVIFDIGAHLGWYSINLSKRFPNSVIHAFEPIKPTYEILERNIISNEIKNVNLHNFGFSDKNKSVSFYYSELGSPIASEENIFNIEEYKKIKCSLTLLDDFVINNNIQQIDFIKCDVEGAEFSIIKGGFKSINRFLPIIVLEIVESWCQKFGYSGNDVIQYLKSLGYSSFLSDSNKLNEIQHIDLNNVEKFNYFFLHPNKHQSLISKLKR